MRGCYEAIRDRVIKLEGVVSKLEGVVSKLEKRVDGFDTLIEMLASQGKDYEQNCNVSRSSE